MCLTPKILHFLSCVCDLSMSARYFFILYCICKYELEISALVPPAHPPSNTSSPARRISFTRKKNQSRTDNNPFIAEKILGNTIDEKKK